MPPGAGPLSALKKRHLKGSSIVDEGKEGVQRESPKGENRRVRGTRGGLGQTVEATRNNRLEVWGLSTVPPPPNSQIQSHSSNISQPFLGQTKSQLVKAVSISSHDLWKEKELLEFNSGLWWSCTNGQTGLVKGFQNR